MKDTNAAIGINENQETLVLGYARISTDRDEGANEQTLGQQLDMLTEYGVMPTNIYSEKVSGKMNLETGAQWLELKARAIESNVPVEIVMVDWSRFSRDGIAFQNAVSFLSKIGCVFTITGDSRYQKYAPQDSMDSMVLAFEAFGAQMYREKISKSTKSKLDFLAANGVKLGRPQKITDSDIVIIEQLQDDGFGAERIATVLSRRRVAAIPAELKEVKSAYAKAFKHAHVSKSSVAKILRARLERSVKFKFETAPVDEI